MFFLFVFNALVKNIDETEKILYDEIGNPTTYRDATMSWYGRQLTNYSKGSVTASFTYDADGLRGTKTVNGTKTVYQYVGDKLFYEKRGKKQEFYYFYDSYGKLSSIYYHYDSDDDEYDSSAVYFVTTNSQGDVIGLYNNKGVKVAAYEYDAWGNILSVKDSTGETITNQDHIANANPFRYRGYYYDSDLGLYYLQSRYYDSTVGRFINADDPEIIDGGNDHILENNLFAYCFNNPVNMTDDTGHWSKWATNLVKVGIGALAIGIGVAATVATGGAAPVLVASLKIAVTSAAIGAAVGAGTNAVNHRVSTGSWNGAGKAALSGAVDGAADGFMWGGISAGATFTTVAAKGAKIQQIGKLKPTNKSGKGYQGVQYKNQRGSLKSFELHSPHKSGPHQRWHWQQNTWNPKTGGITGRSIHWTLFGRRF